MSNKEMISIVTLLYNEQEFVPKFIESVKKQNYKNIEMIFVDNACLDKGYEFAKKLYPEATFIRNKENLGFAKGVNQGIKASKGDYVLLLNPDIILTPDCLEIMKSQMKDDVGVVGGINMPLGKIGKIDEKKVLEIFAPMKNQPVHMVSGSCFLINKKILPKTGLLDEDFFIYWEETEFCYNAWSQGYKVIWSAAPYYHFSGASTKIRKPNPRMQQIYFESEIKYYKKMNNKKRILYPFARVIYNILKRKNQIKPFFKALLNSKASPKQYGPHMSLSEFKKLAKRKDAMAKRLNTYYKGV